VPQQPQQPQQVESLGEFINQKIEMQIIALREERDKVINNTSSTDILSSKIEALKNLKIKITTAEKDSSFDGNFNNVIKAWREDPFVNNASESNKAVISRHVSSIKGAINVLATTFLGGDPSAHRGRTSTLKFIMEDLPKAIDEKASLKPLSNKI
jgi:hypothetical protein